MNLAQDKAEQLGLALVTTAKVLQFPQEPKPKTIAQVIAEALAGRDKRYRENAGRIAAQYKLDVETDRKLISNIIWAEGELKPCASCSGVNCVCLTHKGKQPQIEINSSTRNGAPFAMVECPKYKAARLAENLQKCGLPPKYLDVTLDNLTVDEDNEQAIVMAGKHLETCKDSMYLYGAAGCGKTMLTVLIGRAYLEKGKSVAFWNVGNLLARLQATFNDKSRAHEYEQIMEQCRQSALLILDDMGAEKISEWTVKIMQELINERYNGQKPLMMTSNYTPAELFAEFAKKDKVQAGRIASRLKEMAYFVLAGNKDRRASKAVSC